MFLLLHNKSNRAITHRHTFLACIADVICGIRLHGWIKCNTMYNPSNLSFIKDACQMRHPGFIPTFTDIARDVIRDKQLYGYNESASGTHLSAKGNNCSYFRSLSWLSILLVTGAWTPFFYPMNTNGSSIMSYVL